MMLKLNALEWHLNTYQNIFFYYFTIFLPYQVLFNHSLAHMTQILYVCLHCTLLNDFIFGREMEKYYLHLLNTYLLRGVK